MLHDSYYGRGPWTVAVLVQAVPRPLTCLQGAVLLEGREHVWQVGRNDQVLSKARMVRGGNRSTSSPPTSTQRAASAAATAAVRAAEALQSAQAATAASLAAALEAADEAEGGAGGSGTSEADDACVEAMASFVSESREWALGVQGFLVEHCRDFDGREENKLEWFELHSALTSRMERLLEAELAKLGVPVGDFVARLESSPESKAASELVETVLAMDDFVRFKSMMIKLRADLERALQPIEQDFNVRFAR